MAKKSVTAVPTPTTRAKRGTKKPTKTNDPRVREIADQVFALMNEAGLSANQLAAISGVDQSHLSKFFRYEKGLSMESTLSGDRVLIDAGGWTEGKWVLVRHPNGSHRMHRCERRSGLELLVSDEAIVFNPDVHVVVGVAMDRLERL